MFDGHPIRTAEATAFQRATWRRLSANLLHLLGEPMTFSLHPEDAAPFLARCGFALRAVARAHDAERRHARRGRRLHVYPACHLAHATVRRSRTKGSR